MNRLRSVAFVVAVTVAACSSSVEPSATATPATTPSLTPSPSPSPVVAAPSPTAGGTPDPSVEPVAADLDGVMTTPELAHRLPLAVAIDDSAAARPQSGFNAASIVWQAPADGYETRYLLLFQERDAADIGPVRSARLYIAHWTAELRGALAHYGGDLLSRNWMTANAGRIFTDIDGLGAGNPAYHRIRSREAPHDAYSSTAALWRVTAKLSDSATFDASVHVRPFRDDSPMEGRGTSQRITVPYNTVRVSYEYDAATNAYLRSLDGRPHIDPLDGNQVSARTVVVLYMKFRTDKTIEPGHNRPVLGYIGSGEAKVFMEGRLVKATWSKASVAAPTLIVGANGEELPLLRGRIFIQVVPIGTTVSVR